MKKSLVLIIIVFAFQLYGQKLADQSYIEKYRSNLSSIDSLMQNGILTDAGTGLQILFRI